MKSADMRGADLSGVEVSRRAERVAVPGALVEEFFLPSTQAEVSEVVTAAAATNTGLLISGGRTRLGCANPARPIRLGLSLGGLSGIDEFEPEEGVLHAAAGTPIAEIRAVVRKEGWELPLDSPGRRTTVGGTISSAVTGPRAQAFGSVSDAILGLDVVGGGGVASKCGGRVVKNVTGYDLAKLYCGSFGSLAVVTGAWLRLRPAAARLETYRARLPTNRESFEAVRALAQLTSVRALIWCEEVGDETSEVFVELGGSQEGVAHDRSSLAGTLSLEAVEADRIDTLRDARTLYGRSERDGDSEGDRGVGDEFEPKADEDGVILRVRVLGSQCEAVRRVVLAAGLSVSIDPGLGVIHARGRLSNLEALLAIRSTAERAGGFATFEQLPVAWRGEVDVFGSLGGSETLVETLKSKFDPAGILNPGRYVADRLEDSSRER